MKIPIVAIMLTSTHIYSICGNCGFSSEGFSFIFYIINTSPYSLSLFASKMYVIVSLSDMQFNEAPICWIPRAISIWFLFLVLSPAQFRIVWEAPILSDDSYREPALKTYTYNRTIKLYINKNTGLRNFTFEKLFVYLSNILSDSFT